ncbi:arginine--tRNA ligase [Helicobacter burdigaliensis]|uniref:arginine--tRNA ligase n=1 Tax=Helicobacter burdigaliensis TaxID=2315334 RepID=UPI000EF648EE|nr:arginine--tRNA ligase [Helicobacter burdigaliensis]
MYQVIKDLLSKTLGFECVLERPKDKKFGHFALPTFTFAKTFKKSPQEIAKDFATKLETLKEITNISVVGGYVNFFIQDEFLETCSKNFLTQKDKNPTKKEKILLEYVSANPTGPLHIGHARGAILGDSIARIGKYLGYQIFTEYYINDAGVQISNLGKSIYYAGRHIYFNEDKNLPQDCYQGEYIFDLAKVAYEELGKDCFSSESNIEKLSIFGKDKMLLEIKSNLAQVGIVFDSYVSEKELYSSWEGTYEVLKKSGGTYEKEGKLWIKSSEFGDELDRVIVRENGEPTYLAGDIIYHHHKFKRDFDYYINIWGADHHGYIARVKAALEFLGYDSKKLEILLSQMVALLRGGEAYKMSKRAGNFILMKDVVEDVGSDALRLIFLSKKADTHLEFDVEDLKKQDSSNPVYYINYAHARIHTLLSKTSFSKEEILDTPLKDLKENLRDLLVLALGLEKVLEDSFISRSPQKVVEFLRNLAGEFHRFYNEEKILNSQNEKQILKTLLVVAHSIHLGLELLGVSAKKSM